MWVELQGVSLQKGTEMKMIFNGLTDIGVLFISVLVMLGLMQLFLWLIRIEVL